MLTCPENCEAKKVCQNCGKQICHLLTTKNERRSKIRKSMCFYDPHYAIEDIFYCLKCSDQIPLIQNYRVNM